MKLFNSTGNINLQAIWKAFFMSLLKEFVFEIAWHLDEQLYAKGTKLVIKS